MELKTYIVNSFTDQIACGNPAGVVIYDNELDIDLMQKIAFDINKSETAFIKKENNNKDTYRIRWFSPIKEVALCGHASLAAAKVIFTLIDSDTIAFRYNIGTLLIKKRHDGSIVMDFPIDNYEVIDVDPTYFSFFNITTIKKCFVGKNTKKVVLVLDDNTILKDIKPDFRKMSEYNGLCTNGIAITKTSNQYDFESRYFNPWFGVNEDPVTGSVHTVLAKYWSDVFGKKSMNAFQASQRPGELKLNIKNKDRVEIEGKAKIIISGVFEL